MNAESQSIDAKKIASVDIDSYNILAILRGKFWGLSSSDITDLIVTTTPKVPRDLLQKMINDEKISEAVGELANTVYKDIIPASASNDIEFIMELETNFEAMSVRSVIGAFRSMFSVGIMVAAIKLMIIEVRNISAIAAGIRANGTPRDHPNKVDKTGIVELMACSKRFSK